MITILGDLEEITILGEKDPLTEILKIPLIIRYVENNNEIEINIKKIIPFLLFTIFFIHLLPKL